MALPGLVINIVVHCEGYIVYHVHAAVTAGAIRQELLETRGVGLAMSDGPGSMYVALVVDAIDQFTLEVE